jgi:hypothetical protein
VMDISSSWRACAGYNQRQAGKWSELGVVFDGPSFFFLLGLLDFVLGLLGFSSVFFFSLSSSLGQVGTGKGGLKKYRNAALFIQFF